MSLLNIEAVIKKITEDGKVKWRILSKKGKNLGTFTSRKAALKRLREIEFFKRQ